MPVSTTASTFEFTRDWLASSEFFVRDLMLRTEADDDEARAAAKLRIHSEEILAEPEREADGETAPDLPPPISGRPRALVEKVDDRRELAGTGTWRGGGTVHVSIETPMPEAYRFLPEETSAERDAKFRACRIWCDRVINTLRSELYATSGQGDSDGNPYLNATTIDVELKPIDQEAQQVEVFVGFTLAVEWR